jgi:hypothetical protein
MDVCAPARCQTMLHAMFLHVVGQFASYGFKLSFSLKAFDKLTVDCAAA